MTARSIPLSLARRLSRHTIAALLVLAAAALLSACDPAPQPFASDDFSGGHLGSRWTEVDPLDDGTVTFTGLNTPDARVELSVPAGVAHQPWTTNDSLRLMQRVANTDVGLEVKFDSVPSLAFQEQGILVEQDDGTYLRFEIHHNGSALKAYTARIVDGVATTVTNTTIPTPSGSSIWVRVTRSGDQWNYQTSNNGTSWVTRASLTQPLTVNHAGVYAGNFGSGVPAPAWTAVVDYMFNTASPISPEDPTGPRFEVDTDVVGQGSVLPSPDLPTYAEGQQVTLVATPAPGWGFTGWSGDASGTNPVIQVLATSDLSIVATFEELPPDTVPPVVSAVQVSEVTSSSAVITWSTDEPATSVVAHGPTTAYELGTVSDPALTTEHSLTLDGLAPGNTYHFQVRSTDVDNNTTIDVDRNFTTAPAPPAAFVSDDFRSGVLEDHWTENDPLGDGTVTFSGVGTADARMELAVPAGTNHEAWVPNRSLHVMQDMLDQDVELEAKFDSVPTVAYQEQGILVREDADNYLRFEVNHNGSVLKAYTARIVDGVPTTIANQTIPAGASVWTRVQRTGDQWTFRTSTDGVGWTTRASFTQDLAATEAGVFAGNYGPGSSAPAWTALVDYVFDTSDRLIPEDPVGPLVTLTTTVVGQGSIEPVPDQASYNQGQSLELTAVPSPGWVFTGWSGGVVSTANPLDLVLDDDLQITATFVEQVDVTPPVISTVGVSGLGPTSATISWATNELANATVQYGPTTAYENGTTGSPTYALNRSVPLSNLVPGTTYHYRVHSADPSGNVATDIDRTFTTPPLSGTGPTIDVWYGNTQTFGQPGLGQRWVNVLGRATDPDGVSALSYRLNGGPPIAMGIGPDGRRLAKPGDFNVDVLASSLSAGTNQVRIDAVDGGGALSSTTVTVNYSPVVWPLPYLADLLGAGTPPAVGQVVDGKWEVTGGMLSTVDSEIGYDRLVAIGDASWTNYEARFSMRVNSLSPAPGPNSGEPAAGFLLRWSGHNQSGAGQPRDGFLPNGVEPTPFGGYGLWRNVGPGGRLELRNHFSTLQSSQGSFDLVFGQTYEVRAQVTTAVGNGSHTYRYKVWPSGTGEPVGWNLEYTVAAGPDVPTSGSLVLLAHEADVDFANISVTMLGSTLSEPLAAELTEAVPTADEPSTPAEPVADGPVGSTSVPITVPYQLVPAPEGS